MKRPALYLLTLFLALLCSTQCIAKKDKYNITLTIKNNSDSMMLMGYYYAENIYVFDTAWKDRKGRFVFSNRTRPLPDGMYFFAAPSKNRWVDFVIYHEDPSFSFLTDESDWTNNMQVKGSKENEILFNYQRSSNLAYREFNEKITAADSSTRAELQKALQTEQNNIKNRTIAQYPNSMISKMMTATIDIEVPILDANGDSLSRRQQYEYFMAHYFDHMPLDEDMLVRTPKMVFYQRVMDYFDKYLKGATPEVIISYADSLIEKSRPSQENFKWLVHTLKEKYLHSNITIYEAVCVHLIKRYYLSGDAFWCQPSTIDEMSVIADKWERLLIGKVAPELIMFDTNHIPHSLHNLPHRYKLLVFWSPTCGHCKSIIPQLYEKYNELRQTYDIGTFAILSEPDDATRPKWHKFIADHHLDWLNIDGGEANVDWHDVYDVVTTPQIYLLDENNRIVAKKLNAETFERIVKALCEPRKS